MKTVNDNPADFFKDGGWGFLGGGEDVSVPFLFLYLFFSRRGLNADIVCVGGWFGRRIRVSKRV